MIKVLFVCLGNICRSPMAHAYFKKIVKDKNLEDKIFVDSCGTSSWEVGSPVHHGTKEILDRYNISTEGMKARRLTYGDFEFDYILAMDEQNLSDLLRVSKGMKTGKISLLLSYIGEERSVKDPWYTGNFEVTYKDVSSACDKLLEHIIKEYKL